LTKPLFGYFSQRTPRILYNLSFSRFVTSEFLAIDGLIACTFEYQSLRILQCSRSLAQAIGAESPAELKDGFLVDLFSASSFAKLEEKLRSHGDKAIQCTLQGQSELTVSATILRSAASEPDVALLICLPCEDHQSQVEALQEQLVHLEERSDRLADFTGLVIHDLRNALHLVSANIDLLEQDLSSKKDEENLARRISKIRKAGVGMATILNGVSKYLRFEVGDYPRELTDLNALVDGLMAAVADHPSKSIRIQRINSLPSLICERELVQELFQNLIGNAIKYSDKDNVVIDIGVDQYSSPQPIFFIKDNGVGIAPEDIEYIFQPFTRADRQNLNRHGTGMGMTLVKKIVERHAGTIWLESKVDHGTTVNFSIGAQGLS
jgi:signal transduction histidine kinase